MVELLVMREDAGRFARGEVIALRPDGWAWSLHERSNPAWTILRLPGPIDDFACLMQPGRGAFPAARSFRLDIDGPTPGRIVRTPMPHTIGVIG